MESEEDILSSLFLSLREVLRPLSVAATTPDGVIALLEELGWSPGAEFSDANIEELRAAIREACRFLEEPFDVRSIVAGVPRLLDVFRSKLPSAQGDLGEHLLDALIVRHAQSCTPVAFGVLVFLGLVSLRDIGSTATGRRRRCWTIHWDRILLVVTDPAALFRCGYGWGIAFNAAALLLNLRNALLLAGIPAAFQTDDVDSVRALSSEGGPVLRIPFVIHEEQGEAFEFGVAMIPVKSAAGSRVDGLALVPFGAAKLSTEVDLGSGWSLMCKGGLAGGGGVGFVLRDDGTIEARALDGAGAPRSAASFVMSVSKQSGPGRPIVLFGRPSGSRLEAAAIMLSAAIDADISGRSEFKFELHTSCAGLVISSAALDGFLQDIVPSDGIRAPFDLIMGWSSIDGAYLGGSAGLAVKVPVHRNLGPISLDVLDVSILADASTARLEAQVSATFGAAIGPVALSVERLGVSTDLLLARRPDVSVGILPPAGVGLSVAAGPLTGGGYLTFDREKAEYSGFLQLRFGEIGLSAVGIITTKMPDGTSGYSMLLLPCAEFNPPIQLSFGFTLSAVGGLVGINRSVAVEALRSGLRAGTLGSILFPKDAIQDGPRIVADLQSVFPPTEGRHVIGPMVKIGWGTPNILQGDICVLIELPAPARVVLLGRINVALPRPEDPIVKLQLDVLGSADFAAKSLAIDASLTDSHILGYPIVGDAALRWSWGDNPQFALSIGGFHPKFSPPQGFPELRRVSISLSARDDLELSCKAYQALTPNTLQFGAAVDLYAKSGGASVDGHLSFDALVRFSPFSFRVDMEARVTARYRGHKLLSVRLSFTLSGPRPWSVRGEASFEILWWDISFDFQKKWGSEAPASLPAVDPLDLVTQALGQPGCWGGSLPSGQAAVELLAGQEGGANAQVLVHPLGRLEARQQAAPLGVRLSSVGNAPITGHHTVEIGRVEIDSSGAATQLRRVDLLEHFAHGQYVAMSDAERLSAPSFTRLPAGAAFSADALYIGGVARACTVIYDSVVVGKDGSTVSSQGTLPATQGECLARGNAAARSRRDKAAGLDKFRVPGATPKISVRDERYAVMRAWGGPARERAAGPREEERGLTWMEAREAREEMRRQKRGTSRSLRIVPDHEEEKP